MSNRDEAGDHMDAEVFCGCNRGYRVRAYLDEEVGDVAIHLEGAFCLPQKTMA